MFHCLVGWCGGGWGLLGGILVLLAFGALAAALAIAGVLLVQRNRQATYPNARPPHDEDTLDVRYARGDLTRDEYLRLRDREKGRNER
jgi:uncharacterized membrane protein